MTRWYWPLAIALVTLIWTASALIYPMLPERVPTHWDLNGKVDGHGAKSAVVFLLPCLVTGLMGLFRVLPVLSPKDFEVESFQSTFDFIMVVVLGLFTSMQGIMLYAMMAKGFNLSRAFVGVAFLFSALLGNVLGRVRRNVFVGIRVPWTLASPRVWNDTHRVAAWLLVGGSLIGFAITIAGLALSLALAVYFASLLLPVVYAFVHYKRLERRGEL